MGGNYGADDAFDLSSSLSSNLFPATESLGPVTSDSGPLVASPSAVSAIAAAIPNLLARPAPVPAASVAKASKGLPSWALYAAGGLALLFILKGRR